MYIFVKIIMFSERKVKYNTKYVKTFANSVFLLFLCTRFMRESFAKYIFLVNI